MRATKPVKAFVLVVDKELEIRVLLSRCLANAGYRWKVVATAQDALKAITQSTPDLVILDLELPDVDAQKLLRQLRMSLGSPIIALSEDDQESKKLEAFRNWADDYVIKPFFPAELVARVRLALRHTKGKSDRQGPLLFETGGLRIDLAAEQILVNGKEIHLTPTEYKLLSVFVRHPGSVLSPEYLLTEVWGPEHAKDKQYLKTYLVGLRRKIEPIPESPRLLVTEGGAGYKLVPRTEQVHAGLSIQP